MSVLELSQISKIYATPKGGLQAVQEVSLSVRENEFVVLLGPSGCGKSTLLRMVAGLEEPTSGRTVFRGEEIRGPNHERGMLFQDYALFPWRTVLKNVEFGPEMRGLSPKESRGEARTLINRVGLSGFEDAYPHQLSGGMRQRVAIARVLANRPRLILMDEPFASLDAITRSQMQRQLTEVFMHERATVLFVTHSLDEALLLGDTIYVFTPRPASIKTCLSVCMKRPRDTSSEAFQELRQRLTEMI